MERLPPAANPEAYVAGLDGWRRDIVARLRAIARKPAGVTEAIRWGHLVYSANGPAYLVRAEASRVLFGFWRGQRLSAMEPRLKPGGKYEMATIELREGDTIASKVASALVAAAVELNATLGNPTDVAPGKPKGT